MKKFLLLSALLCASLFLSAQSPTKTGQDTVNKALRQIRTSLQTGTLNVSVKTATIGQSALPSGAATSALQTTGNTHLSNLRTDVQNVRDEVVNNTNTLTIMSQQLEGLIRQKLFVTSFTVAPASACTDLVQFTGANTGVMIRKIILSGTQTTGGKVLIAINVNVGANTGGTSSVITPVSYDQSGAVPVSTSEVRVYTANPTVGAGTPARIRLMHLPVTATTDQNNSSVTVDFGTDGYLLPISSGSQFHINLLGQTLTGGVISCTIIWSEVF